MWLDLLVGPLSETLGCGYEGHDKGPVFISQLRESGDCIVITLVYDECVIDHIVDVLLQDVGDVREVHQHSFLRYTALSHYLSIQLHLPSIPVAVHVPALALVIRHAMAGVGLDPSPDPSRHHLPPFESPCSLS